ncbi:LacI family DNA-binding transcriptional regulator [Paramicrobacterium chengjingii]|uniref:LacI family DNA-binding transcriptional regulator n=1 Tax=Paramicrobacterium chengjingii TaxID=2769067 RepID=A0ABX6YJY5_9MICO|nr:LacI family DNA-binding transcriptional regulator [Microbacterium chengjingii]QPZ38950.1 LacI family DNA-binding transcriptional regulator [Microbacterium chengjingii]
MNKLSSSKPTTINDVARAAGVSRQTVTRALNNMPDVSAVTRERVIAAASALNYRPNRAAQGLVRGSKPTIGLVVSDLRNPYYPELASELTRKAGLRGWSVVLCDLGDDPDDAHRRLETVAQRVDAMVGHVAAGEWKGALANTPTVVLDGPSDSAKHAVIAIDYEPGIRAAIDHLKSAGCSRIAMVDAGRAPSIRRQIYRRLLNEYGLQWSPDSELVAPDTHDGGVRAAARLCKQNPQTDAVLAFNDVMAVGMLKGFARADVNVPSDIAVVGIDGLDIGTLVTPELTSIAIDKAKLADIAIELVDALLDGVTPPDERLHRTATHTLAVRESA